MTMTSTRSPSPLLWSSYVAMTLILALAGCSSGPVDPGPGDPGPATPAPSETEPMYDAGCSVVYPDRESLSTTFPDEEEYLDDIPVCSNTVAGNTLSIITNNSDAVWYFVNPDPLTLERVSGDDSTALFRETVSSGNLFASQFMAPSETLSLPLGFAELTEFQWHIEPTLTATWLAQDVYKSSFEKMGASARSAALAQGSKSRKALIDCATSYWSVVKSAGLTGASGEDQLIAAFGGVSAVGTCTSAWRLAEAEGGTRVPAFTNAVENAGRAAGTATKIHTGWRLVSIFCGAAKLC